MTKPNTPNTPAWRRYEKARAEYFAALDAYTAETNAHPLRPSTDQIRTAALKKSPRRSPK